MEMLAHTCSHYESMFSSAALVYSRCNMCQSECIVSMCAEELLAWDSPLDIQVAHSQSSRVALSCRSFRIVAVLVISGSSRRLGSCNSAVYICVYWPN